MLRILLKTLTTLWPFLRTMVFQDRSIGEVILKNKQFTLMFILLLALAMFLVLAILESSRLKEDISHMRKTASATQTELVTTKAEFAATQTELATLKAKAKVVAKDCIPPDNSSYDKKRLIELLE